MQLIKKGLPLQMLLEKYLIGNVPKNEGKMLKAKIEKLEQQQLKPKKDSGSFIHASSDSSS